MFRKIIVLAALVLIPALGACGDPTGPDTRSEYGYDDETVRQGVAELLGLLI
jgi:hypothetical protein